MFHRSACATVSRPSRFGRAMVVVVVASACLGPSASAIAQRLDKASQDWLKQYRLLVLPDEAKVLQRVKAADLDEFVRIFWARRNPVLASGEDPHRAVVEKVRAAADARFGDVGKRGSETACAQVTMLLGEPDEVIGRDVQPSFDTRLERESKYRQTERASRNATRDGARRPELWTYKSNATRTFRMPGGDLRLQFDDGCEFDEGARTLDELARVAAERVVHPEIRYEFGADGRLRRLETAAPATSPARALLDQPRSDFGASFEPKIQVPGQGGAYTAGILRGAPGALPPSPDAAPVKLRAVARATPSTGPAIQFDERDVFALVQADGSFVTSYGFIVSPGQYSVVLAVLDPATSRGAVATFSVESPDYAAKTMIVGPLAVLSGAGGPAAPVPADPYAAFAIGAERLMPRPGNVLSQSDSLRLLVLVHNATLDPASSRASLRAAFSVLRDGKLVAKGSEQTFDTAGAAASVGPIALTPFAPGRYLARVEITDEVSKATVVREATFEVTARPPGR